ncbi:MAG: glycosyltransferase [Anaerolineales bacterium]|nr:glycosyltransferase [Anaerolineales bacterium]
MMESGLTSLDHFQQELQFPSLLIRNKQIAQPGICVVIPARDEEAVIGETLDWLGAFLSPVDRVHVIADRCTDGTARIAWKHGAIVHVRRGDGEAGKGAALRWWLEQTSNSGNAEDPILVLDADSRISPDLIDRIRSVIRSGQQVIQVRVAPLVGSGSPVALLAALSEVVEQRVKDPLRSRFGWPVRLRGTGMVLQRGLLEMLSSRLTTFVEDIELTLLLVERRIPICFLDDVFIADPKPENVASASRQRARWFRGQLHVLRVHRKTVLRIMGRGPAGWSLLASIFLKPTTLFLLVRTILFFLSLAGALVCGETLAGISAGLLGTGLIVESGFYLLGLRYVPDQRQMLLALARVPLYVLMWFRSLCFSMLGGDTWLRVRPGIVLTERIGGFQPDQRQDRKPVQSRSPAAEVFSQA